MRSVSLLGLLLGVVLVGCGSPPSLVGRWTGESEGSESTLEFSADHTWKMISKTENGSLLINATYALDGEKFSAKITSVEVIGVPAQYEATAKKSVAGLKGKDISGTLKFINNDEAELTTKESQGQPQLIKRSK